MKLQEVNPKHENVIMTIPILQPHRLSNVGVLLGWAPTRPTILEPQFPRLVTKKQPNDYRVWVQFEDVQPKLGSTMANHECSAGDATHYIFYQNTMCFY